MATLHSPVVVPSHGVLRQPVDKSLHLVLAEHLGGRPGAGRADRIIVLLLPLL